MKRLQGLPLVADFILFIALCVSAAYWGMQLFKPQVRPVTAPPQAAPVALNIEAAAGLFGGRPAGEVVASNFQLKGVIAAGPEGVAILAAEGKPPQAVGVNMEAAPGVTLKEVHPQYVLLDEGGMVKRVELPQGAKGGMELGGPASAGPSGAPMPAPAMNANNGQIPSQQPPVGRQGVNAPQPVPMQQMIPPPGPQPAGPNEAPMPSPIPGGGHPGLQK